MLRLELGKYYKDRNGKIIGPMRHYKFDSNFRFESNGAIYTDNGYYSLAGPTHPKTLVQEIPSTVESGKSYKTNGGHTTGPLHECHGWYKGQLDVYGQLTHLWTPEGIYAESNHWGLDLILDSAANPIPQPAPEITEGCVVRAIHFNVDMVVEKVCTVSGVVCCFWFINGVLHRTKFKPAFLVLQRKA